VAVSNDVVLVRGRIVETGSADNLKKEVYLSIAPTSINKKLAIRRMNDAVAGRTIRSTTYFEK
jgi:hypothetical protein